MGGYIRTSPYNDPAIGAAMSNIASMFGPPPASDIAAYATAKERNAQASATEQEAQRLAELEAYAKQQGFDKTTFDRMGQAAGRWNPSNGYYGADLTASTSRANNADDNSRAFATSMLQPLSQGQVRPAVPGSVASQFGFGSMPAEQGNPKPLSETEWNAQRQQRLLTSGQLTDQDLVDLVFGKENPVEAIGANGKPTFMTPGAATRTGAQPAPKSPLVNIGPNGVDYGQPGDGLAWARNPDNSVKLDERGAPIAVPYQGGKVYLEQQRAAAAAANKGAAAGVQTDNVNAVIDNTISQIKANQTLTTGLGAQLTAGIGGSPGGNVAAQLVTLRANGAFDKLQELRDASPTGGALGQVSNYEEQMLASAVANLEQSQGSDQLLANLTRFKQVRYDIVNGPGEFEKLFNADGSPKASAGGASAPPPDVTEDDIQFTMKKHGLTREQVLQQIGGR